jgi:hypothetical protein
MERRHAGLRRRWIGGAIGLLLLAAPAWATSVVDGTPWSGSQDQGGGTAAPGDTNRVDIVFDPSKSELTTPCEEIVLIQTSQTLANGIPVDPGTYSDSFDFQDADAIDDQPDTSGDETGTCVDSLEGDSTPYYQDTGGGSVGSSNGHSTNSSLGDEPSTSGGNRGFPSLTTVTDKFETCAFCAKGEDAGHYFGGITWEYTKTAGDQAAGTPGTSTFTGTSNQPSPGFTAAVDQWAANHDFDLP